jgi:hypothetical protein
MAVSVADFILRNTIFDGRRPVPIQAALDEAAKMYDAAVCGTLTDNLVEAQARLILLEDPSGLPTSSTGDKTDLIDNAKQRLLRLKRQVPVRGLGTQEC